MRRPRSLLLAALLATALSAAGLAASAAPAATSTYTITDLGSLGSGATVG
jgi:hypothetical protein